MTGEILAYLNEKSYSYTDLITWLQTNCGITDINTLMNDHIKQLLQKFYIIPREPHIELLYEDIPNFTPQQVEEIQSFNQQLCQFSRLSSLLWEGIDERTKLLQNM